MFSNVDFALCYHLSEIKTYAEIEANFLRF
jgi:hypothetical protein